MRAIWTGTLLLGSFMAIPAEGATAAAGATANYQVTFDATWSEQTHPKKFPSGAHFSPLVGAVHRPDTTFWRSKKKASKGMEKMAEVGSTFLLTQEINAAINDGEAKSAILGSGISSPGSTSVMIEVDALHSAVTLVSMIAPSPDWFIGVNGVELMEDGEFVDELVVELFAYDAGTDAGKSYNSKNDNESPKRKIKRLKKGPFKKVKNVPLGTFRFTRIP